MEEAEEHPVNDDEKLKQYIISVLSGAQCEPIASRVTLATLDKMSCLISDAPPSHEPKQVALARIFASYSGARAASMHKLMPWEWEKIGNRLMVQLTRHRGRLQKARHRKSQQQRVAAKLSAENMWVACPYWQHRKELLQIGVAPDAAPSSFRRTADNEVIHGQFVSTRDENTVTAVIDVPGST
mmetsp:Transcript_47955/g.118714  ORF Transcript_47955/g.118714 Transcript_47955/m.118714 type:complete len:184 (-) Transcript_47955:176-727(-)